MKTKSIWIEAPFKETGHWETEKVKVGTKTVQINRGLFKEKIVEEKQGVYEERKTWIVDTVSDTEVDFEKLNELINDTLITLENEGYEVLTVTPLTTQVSREYDVPFYFYGGNTGNGVQGKGTFRETIGYTAGVNIIAKKLF